MYTEIVQPSIVHVISGVRTPGLYSGQAFVINFYIDSVSLFYRSISSHSDHVKLQWLCC